MPHYHFFVCTTHPGIVPELDKVLKEIHFPFEYDIAYLDRVESSEEAIKEEFKKADVAISDPHVAPLLSHPEVACPKLRWFQSTFAGVDNFQKMIPNPYGPEYAKLPFTVTRGATLYGPAMAEYALGAMLMIQRSFLVYKNLQPTKQSPWANRKPGLVFPLLSTQTVGILGASGSIGQDTARRFHTLGCKVWGLCRRHRKEGEPQLTPQVESHLNATLPPADKAFEKMFALEDEKDESQAVLKEFLAGCDVIINVLPGTTETKYLLGGRTGKDGQPLPCPLQACKPHCIFINVGRGTIIKAESLVEALQKKWICHAVLDVFETEPLPETSPLVTELTADQITLTPHVSGAPQGNTFMNDLLRQNISLFAQGMVDELKSKEEHEKDPSKPIKSWESNLFYMVDWHAGY